KVTVFWQIDYDHEIRTGKLIAYDSRTGKRIKKYLSTSNGEKVDALMIHKTINKDFSHQLCFFGEHLLSEYPNKPVAIVESEKTAIIASLYMPQFNWIA